MGTEKASFRFFSLSLSLSLSFETEMRADRACMYIVFVFVFVYVQVARQEGVSALWKGVLPFSTHLTLKYALRMSTNATFQNLLRDKETGELTQSRRLAAGFGAFRVHLMRHTDRYAE